MLTTAAPESQTGNSIRHMYNLGIVNIENDGLKTFLEKSQSSTQPHIPGPIYMMCWLWKDSKATVWSKGLFHGNHNASRSKVVQKFWMAQASVWCLI